jgi:hypothetical protein
MTCLISARGTLRRMLAVCWAGDWTIWGVSIMTVKPEED